MRQPWQSIFLAVLVFGAAIAAFAAHGAATRAASMPVDGPSGVVMLAGSQLAVVVPVFHNGQHTNVTTVAVGTSVHVKVTVAGAFGTPEGSVFGSIYANGTCSGQAVDVANPGFLEDGALDLTSLTWKPTASGKLSVSVHYDGDATYAARTSPCTAIDVTKATPSVAVKVHNPSHTVVTSVLYGFLVHPYVTVTSRVGAPTGNITVSWWTNDTCSGGAASVSSTYLLASGAVDTGFLKLSPAGKYAFKAHYNGDAGFKAGFSVCVPYTVTKWAPVFISQVHDLHHLEASVLLVNAQVHPYVSVEAPDSKATPTGDVTVHWYLDGDCMNQEGSFVRPAAVDMELYDMATDRPSPGAESWRMEYSGDDIYKAAAGGCIKRTWKGQPTINFVVHDADHDVVPATAPLGTEIHFKATVAGDYGTPDGTVTIRQYANGTCDGAGTKIAMSALSNGVGHDLQHLFTLDAVGTVSYRGDYGGNASYLTAQGACRSIKVTAAVATPSPTATPTPKPTAKPTPKPTATPVAEATAQPAATDVAPVGSAEPSSSGEPAASDVPTASEEPASTDGATVPGASPAPGASGVADPGPSAAAGAGAGSGASGAPTSPSGDGGLGAGWLLLLLLVVVAVFGAGIAFGRRRSQQPGKA